MKLVSTLLSDLKHHAREFYADKSEMEIAMELSRYSQKDIKDMMEAPSLE